MSTTQRSKSRLTLARAAIRPAMKGRVMLSGPSGAGKTYTALLIAEYLVGENGRVLHIDTEKESSLTYAELFQFEHLRWNAPFDAAALAQTIMDAGDSYDAVIVDSFSHFWRKQGGILDVAGGRFTGWKEARPLQEDVIDAVLETDAHVILCCRSKMEHTQTQNVQTGKIEVHKVGLKAQQDDDLEYEVNVSLDIDMTHLLSVSKSRTNQVPVGTMFQPGHAGDFATVYRDWLKGGEPVAARKDTDALAASINTIVDDAERLKVKRMFVDAFGRPEFLLVSRLKEAQEWVADRVAGVAPPADRAEAAVPAGGEPAVEGPDGSGSSGQEAATAAPDAPTANVANGDGMAEPSTVGDTAGESAPPVDELARRTALMPPWLHSLTATKLRDVAEASGLTGITKSTTPGQLREALDGFYRMVFAGEVNDARACVDCGGYATVVPPWAKQCECAI